MPYIGQTGIGSTPYENKALPPLPEGQYVAVVEDSKQDIGESGHEYIMITWRIIEGEHVGRIIADFISLNNPAAWSVKQTQEKFAAYRFATSKPEAGNTEDFHGIPCVIELRITRPKNGKDPGNKISKYLPLQRQPAANSQAVTAGQYDYAGQGGSIQPPIQQPPITNHPQTSQPQSSNLPFGQSADAGSAQRPWSKP